MHVQALSVVSAVKNVVSLGVDKRLLQLLIYESCLLYVTPLAAGYPCQRERLSPRLNVSVLQLSE